LCEVAVVLYYYIMMCIFSDFPFHCIHVVCPII